LVINRALPITTIFEVTFSAIALEEVVGVGDGETRGLGEGEIGRLGEGETRGMGVARLGVAV
jgi:hypothetical protein